MIPVITPEMIPEAVPIAMSVAIRICFFFFFFAISLLLSSLMISLYRKAHLMSTFLFPCIKRGRRFPVSLAFLKLLLFHFPAFPAEVHHSAIVGRNFMPVVPAEGLQNDLPRFHLSPPDTYTMSTAKATAEIRTAVMVIPPIDHLAMYWRLTQ